MKAGWETNNLASLCAVFADGDWVESKDQSPDGVRLVQTGNVGLGEFKDRGEKARYISEETFKRLRCTEIHEGDCLVSRLPDPVGRACIIPDTGEKMITAVDCTIIRFQPEKVLPTFFNYYAQSREYLNAVASQSTGATRLRISRANLGEIPVPTPPLPEQQRIVTILDQAFEGIATAKANAEKNLRNARELFESELHTIFAQKRNDWQERPLGELCVLITKGSSPKWQGISYVDKPGVLFVTSENIGEYQLVMMDKPKYVEEKFNIKDKKSILCKGDVLTNIVGASIGRTAIYDLDDVANINQAVCLLRCNSVLLDNRYLTYLLNSPVLINILHDNEVNNARANLSLGFFSQLPVPHPSVEEQRKIVARFEEIQAETKKLESIHQQKLVAFDELKKSILHEAFNGNIN